MSAAKHLADRIALGQSGFPRRLTQLMAATLATGTITASDPALSVTQTWNNSGVTFVAKDTNITDSASAAASILERWRVGGVEMASIRKDGLLTTAGGISSTTGVFSDVVTGLKFNGLTVTTTTGTLTLANSKTLTVSNTITFTATDGSSLAIGAGGTLGTMAYETATDYLSKAGNLAGLDNQATARANIGLGNVENTALSTWAGTTNITTLGTITAGTWNGSVVAGQYGGTGVANTGKTITLGGNFVLSGAFSTTFAVGATTSLTLPATGTLATLAGAEALTNKSLNGMTVTASTGTFTLTDLKTLTVSNTLTFVGTDTATLNIGGGGTLASMAYQAANNVAITGGTIDGTPIGGNTATTINGTVVTATTAFRAPSSGTVFSFTGDTTTGMGRGGTGDIRLSGSGVDLLRIISSGIVISAAVPLAFGSSGIATPDVFLRRDGAAATLALSNSTTAQKFRVYGTTTGSKYVQVEHDGTNAIFSATAGILSFSQRAVFGSATDDGVNALQVAGAAAVSGALTLSQAHSHALGTTSASDTQLNLGGAATSLRIGIRMSSTLTPATGQPVFGIFVNPAVTTSSSGTHSLVAGLHFTFGTLTSGGATVTDIAGANFVGFSSFAAGTAATVRISSAPTGGTTNWALDIIAGQTRLPGASVTAPSITFGDASTGIYRVSTNSIGFTCNGADVGRFNTSGLLLADAMNVAVNTSTGTKIGTSTSQKLGFWNATPIVQPASANQAAITDSTGGTASGTLAAITAGVSYAQADMTAVKNALASLARLQDSMRTALVNTGLMKGAA